jgi:hypothetical protein
MCEFVELIFQFESTVLKKITDHARGKWTWSRCFFYGQITAHCPKSIVSGQISFMSTTLSVPDYCRSGCKRHFYAACPILSMKASFQQCPHAGIATVVWWRRYTVHIVIYKFRECE